MKKLFLLASAVLVLSLLTPSAEAQLLVIDLVTNYAPGSDFARVRIEVVDRADERRSWVSYHATSSAADYVRGVRIAEFDDVTPGTYSLVVELLDGLMRPVHTRMWLYGATDRDFITTTLIVRP